MTKPLIRPHSADIFGAEVQYFRLEPRDWETVLRRLADSGLTCVTTYVPWSVHQIGPPDDRHPAGVLDFTGRTEPRRNLMRYLELVERLGLRLNFRCGPFCCNEMVHGGLPPWLVLGDPSLMVWDSANRPTQGYWIARKEGMQPSYLHPAYLAACRAWLAAVDRIILPHLHAAGGCISMLNLDNEVSYIVRDSFLESDYNPVNVRPGGFYHAFLREKYGTAARLPYPGRYRHIEEVAPPRQVPEAVGDDFAYCADWVAFKTWVMTEYVRRLRMMHEAHGVRDVTFMTNLNPHLPEGVPTRLADFEAAVGPRGLVGYDFYRGAFMSYSGYHSMARVLKLMQASLRYTWSAEFMSGTWNLDLTKAGRISDDHMRFMARCALAQGCKALAWFMFHDRDCWGDTPVSAHGHARPSLAVLRETRALACDHIRNWDDLVPQSDVALLYDLAQHQHTAIGDPSPCNDNDLHIGRPRVDGVEAGRASQEYTGLFRLVEQAGVQPAVVDPLCNLQQLARYPLAFLPGGPVLTRATRAALRRFVAGGGRLVVSGPLPTRDERGRKTPFLPRRSFTWHPAWLAQEKPEQEDRAAAAFVARLVRRHVPHPHVAIRPVTPVSWVDWANSGGGAQQHDQPRNLGSAILHAGPDDTLLFVLNHYPVAVRFNLTLADRSARQLVDLDTDQLVPVQKGCAVVDVDRKSGSVYRVQTAGAPTARP